MNLCPPGLSQPGWSGAVQAWCGQGQELRAGAFWDGAGEDQPAGHSASRASTRLALTSTYG